MSKKVVCPDCGFSNESNERFCILCDARLGQEAQGGSAPAPAPAPAPHAAPSPSKPPPAKSVPAPPPPQAAKSNPASQASVADPASRSGAPAQRVSRPSDETGSKTPRGTAVTPVKPSVRPGPEDRAPAAAGAPAAPTLGPFEAKAAEPRARPPLADPEEPPSQRAAKRPAAGGDSSPAWAGRAPGAAGAGSGASGTSGASSGSGATSSGTGSSGSTPRPKARVARPEDFPNSILRKVAAGEQVAEGSKDAFQRKRRAGGGVAVSIEAGRIYRAGATEDLRFRIESQELVALDVEVHVDVTDVVLERQVLSTRLEDAMPCDLTLPFRATAPGRKTVRQLEVVLVDPTGDIRLFKLRHDAPPPELEIGDGTSAGEPRWQALDLEPLDRDKLAESLQSVLAAAQCLEAPKSLVGAARVRPAAPLLQLEVAGDPRRLFIHLPDGTVFFGRKKPAAESAANHLVLRLLPCRSQEEDPQNWNQTMAISGTHGALVLKEGGLVLQNMSRHGIILNGKKMANDEHMRIPDVFVLMLAGVLRLKGRIFAPTRDASMLRWRSAPPSLPSPDGYDAAMPGLVDCYHLRRVANQEEDEYLILYRNAALGASPVCPIRVAGDGVAPIHARLLRHRSALFITPERGVEGAVQVEGRALRRDEAAPVGAGSEIKLGDVTLRFQQARSADQIAAT